MTADLARFISRNLDQSPEPVVGLDPLGLPST